MNVSSIDTLRRFLFDLPARSNFSLTDDVKFQLRKELFRAVSCDGLYLNLFFPEIFDQNESDSHSRLDSVIQWSLFKYAAYVARMSTSTEGRSHHAYHTDSPCSRVFRRGEPIYKCLTCGFNDTCALCSNCFQSESHEGHNINVTICVRDNGGVCDCGDPEAWIKDFRCVYHETNDSFERLKTMKPSLDLQETLLVMIGVLLDFIIDVMSQSDQQFSSPKEKANAANQVWSNRELNPRRYGYSTFHCPSDQVSQKYSLIAYNDQIRHFRDAVQRIHLASKKVPEFAEMVAKRIQDHGRATVIRSRDPNLLIERQRLLSATGLSSCIRNARDEFREEMCYEIIQWLESLSSCDLLKANEPLRNLFCRAFCMRWERGLHLSSSFEEHDRGFAQLDSDFDIPKSKNVEIALGSLQNTQPEPWEHIEPLCQECGYSIHDYQGQKHIGSRLQYLAFLDIRFWKAFRLALHTMYATTLITNLKWKGVICYQYCDIYPFISDMFLNLDGDPEINVMCTLSCQLFISPSNSAAILSHGDVSRIICTVISFFKTGRTHSTSLSADTDISLNSLKNRRWGQLFFDIGYIVSRGQNSDVSLTESMVPMTCDLLSLFQGKPTMRREVESHVEYESSDYTAFFHAIPIIYQLAEYVSHCLKNGEAKGLKAGIFPSAIRHVAGSILRLENHPSNSRDHNEVDYGGFSDGSSMKSETKAVVSFLHPLHSFLSWLIEYASFKDSDDLIKILRDASIDVRNDTSREAFEHSLTCIFHYPIQSIVLAAQVKTGFWVRNGFSVKNQLQLYKSTGLREQGYLRDIFLTQIYLICHDVDKTVSEILRLWLLDDGLLPESKSSYDKSTLPYILEECLSFFLHVLTEGLFMRSLSINEITQIKIEDEIIHQLCLGSMNYSKLSSQIPEHIVSERFFDSTLERVAHFRKPTSGKESGTFILKEEYFKRVNPYYHNYTSNKKDEVLKLMKERHSKNTNQPVSEVVIEPLRTSFGKAGIYGRLGRFTSSHHFVGFLVTCLQFVSQEGPHKLDGLLDTLLHVIHSCAFKDCEESKYEMSFCDRAVKAPPGSSPSLAQTLYDTLLHDDMKDHHAKVRAIFRCFSKGVNFFETIMDKEINNFDLKLLNAPCDNLMENDSERKKRMALQRQKKLLAKFKKQQSSFLQRNDMANDDSDAEMEDAEEDGWKFPVSHCILCQDTARDAGPFGLIVHVSRSSEFRNVPFESDYWRMKAFSDNINLNGNNSQTIPETTTRRHDEFLRNVEEGSVIGPGFPINGNVSSKLVSSTCGHGMHFNCYVQFLASNRSRSNHITRNTPDNIEHREFLCPLCKALNNMFVPILWTANNRSLKQFLLPTSKENAFSDLSRNKMHDKTWFNTFCKSASEDLQKYSILTNVAKDIIGQDSDSLASTGQQQFRMLLSNMFQILSLLTFPQILKADSSNILVNTIKATEISLRGTSCPSGIVYHQVTNNALINLRALNEFRITSLLMKTSNWVKNSHQKPDTHVKILANLLTLSAENFNKSILQHDFLEVLVNVFPMPTAGYSFHEILRVCFIGHIIQTLNIIVQNVVERNFFRKADFTLLDFPFSEMIAPDDAHFTMTSFSAILDSSLSEYQTDEIILSPKFGYIIFSMLLKSITPFLRQAAIFSFVNCHSESELYEESDSSIFEADKLCAILNLPTLSGILREFSQTNPCLTLESTRFKSFLASLQNEQYENSKIERRSSLEYPGLISLVRLPDRLDDFFTRYYYSERYDFPHLAIENPAVCMFCGEVCDLQRATLGSRHGQCTTHYTKKCQNSVGIFLLPKDRSILLLNKNGGSFHAIPYIDSHFEVAGDNKKTRAVYLQQSRYDDFIRSLWLQHNISNYIVRKLDGVIDAGGWETL